VEAELPFLVRPADPDRPEAVALLGAYLDELRSRIFPIPVDADPHWPEDYRRPGGAVLLAWSAGRAVGCAGLRPLEPGTVELKRLYLVPEVRGRGLGKRFMAAIEDEARSAGHRRLLLDTAAPLREAAAMYRSMGYVPIPAYNANPRASAWFSRDLVRAPR